MKTSSQFAVVLALLAGWISTALAVDPPESGTNTLQGVVQFVNADPDILARLGPPGNEGMKNLVIYATSTPPDPLQSVKIFYDVDKLSTPYALTVAANDEILHALIPRRPESRQDVGVGVHKLHDAVDGVRARLRGVHGQGGQRGHAREQEEQEVGMAVFHKLSLSTCKDGAEGYRKSSTDNGEGRRLGTGLRGTPLQVVFRAVATESLSLAPASGVVFATLCRPETAGVRG